MAIHLEMLGNRVIPLVANQAAARNYRWAEPAEAWLAKVEARAAVDRALASVEDQLKASLSGQAPVEKRTN